MKVVIIDDDKLVSMSLKTILEASGIEVSAVGEDGSEAVALFEACNPDVIMMDIRMQKVDGIEASRQLLSQYPEAKVLLLTTFSDDEYIMSAFSLGVKGYILKQDLAGIVPALNAVAGGQNVFGGKVIDKLPALMKSTKVFDYKAYDISDKEYEIIELVADGLNNKEIADKACLSEGTVRNYISTILEKLELRDRTQLAVFYYQNGGK